MTRPRSMKVYPFKIDLGIGIVGYVLQVRDPSFEDIDCLREIGWEPNPPVAAKGWDLKNTVLFWTGDRDLALSCGITAEEWDAAPNMIELGPPMMVVEKPEGMSDDEFEVWADEEIDRRLAEAGLCDDEVDD
jgi:hypothetical protein